MSWTLNLSCTLCEPNTHCRKRKQNEKCLHMLCWLSLLPILKVFTLYTSFSSFPAIFNTEVTEAKKASSWLCNRYGKHKIDITREEQTVKKAKFDKCCHGKCYFIIVNFTFHWTDQLLNSKKLNIIKASFTWQIR